MSRTKELISILMVLVLITLSGASVWAAPGGQEEPTATPTEMPAETPTPEPTETPTPEPTEEPAVHPVALALAEFFADTLGLDYDMIMDYHEKGIGFGVIAQACWMSLMLDGEVTVGDILAAKKSGDFSAITLPDGTTPRNWGQFKKAILSGEKARKNLGAIMSGTKEGEQVQEQEQARDRDRDREKQGKGSEESGPPGQGPDRGGGPPVEPPGKSKGNEGSEPPGQDRGGGKGKGH